jgi:hypothetical protein
MPNFPRGEAHAMQIILRNPFEMLLYGKQMPELRRKREACLSQELTPSLFRRR